MTVAAANQQIRCSRPIVVALTHVTNQHVVLLDRLVDVVNIR